MDQKTEDGEQRTELALKPCPCCGEMPITDLLDIGMWWVICRDGCNLASGVYEEEVEAVAAWNRRTPSERDEFGQILAGLKARGVITQEDVERLERDGMKEVADAG